MECPACSGKRHDATELIRVYRCKRCGAIFGECYLGDSYRLVLPYWAEADVPAERTRYFDLMTLGGEGIQRRHGWYDPETRRITQTG